MPSPTHTTHDEPPDSTIQAAIVSRLLALQPLCPTHAELSALMGAERWAERDAVDRAVAELVARGVLVARETVRPSLAVLTYAELPL